MIIDIIVFKFTGVATIIAAALGLAFFVVSLILSIMTLKTEVKAQAKACEILKNENMATDEEIGMMKELFRIYNIQYINDIILEFLQLVMKILEFAAKIAQHSSSSGSN